MADDLADLIVDIELGPLSKNEAELTIEQCIADLEAAKTRTDLYVTFDEYLPTPENNRRVIEPLCRSISNLRLHNAQHPLRKLALHRMDKDEMEMDDIETMEGVLAQFLDAAKQFGIFQMELSNVFYLPVQILVEFCRDNKSLKVLELEYVTFSGGGAAISLPLNNGPPNSSVILTLDKLTLDGVECDDSTAATVFANLVTHVNVSSLELGNVDARNVDDEATERILSELKLPSAEQLTLIYDCQTKHFKAALDAGTTTVTHLRVYINGDLEDETAKLELLASFIRRAVKLNSLKLVLCSDEHQSSPPPLLFEAMEACATVTQIRVILKDKYGVQIVPNVSPKVQQLEKITSRNRELDRFATNPGTYPTAELPGLMSQCDNCPTGRYMLARDLPEVLSFAELYAMHLSRRRTNSPGPKKAKLE